MPSDDKPTKCELQAAFQQLFDRLLQEVDADRPPPDVVMEADPEPEPAPEPAAAPQAPRPALWLSYTPPTKAQQAELQRPISEIRDAFMEVKRPGTTQVDETAVRVRSAWKNPKTGDDAKRAKRRFVELVGDVAIGEITPDVAVDSRKKLARSPAERRRKPYLGLPAHEGIALADRLRKENLQAVEESLRPGDEIAREHSARSRGACGSSRSSTRTRPTAPTAPRSPADSRAIARTSASTRRARTCTGCGTASTPISATRT